MRKLIQYLKNKAECQKYIQNGCDKCPYVYDQHDWWGCTLGFRTK